MKLARVQLSVAVGSVHVTDVEHADASVFAEMFPGHPLITGGVVSMVEDEQQMVPPLLLRAATTVKLPKTLPTNTVPLQLLLIVALGRASTVKSTFGP